MGKDCSVKIGGACLCLKHKLTKPQSQKFHKLRQDIEDWLKFYSKTSGWIIKELQPQVHKKIRNALADYFEKNVHEVKQVKFKRITKDWRNPDYFIWVMWIQYC